MDDLIAFLRARLDEDEDVARKAKGVPNYTWPLWTATACHSYGHDLGPRGSVEASPARVLADIDTKRRIIDEILWYEAKIDSEWGCCHDPEAIAAGQCPDINPNEITALRLLALPYAGHEQFREEWRP